MEIEIGQVYKHNDLNITIEILSSPLITDTQSWYRVLRRVGSRQENSYYLESTRGIISNFTLLKLTGSKKEIDKCQHEWTTVDLFTSSITFCNRCDKNK